MLQASHVVFDASWLALAAAIAFLSHGQADSESAQGRIELSL